jgi:hypothetical protein
VSLSFILTISGNRFSFFIFVFTKNKGLEKNSSSSFFRRNISRFLLMSVSLKLNGHPLPVFHHHLVILTIFLFLSLFPITPSCIIFLSSGFKGFDEFSSANIPRIFSRRYCSHQFNNSSVNLSRHRRPRVRSIDGDNSVSIPLFVFIFFSFDFHHVVQFC